MKLKKAVICALMVVTPILVQAHPVSYQDGIGLMSYNSSRMNELLLTYSFSPRFAVAHSYLRQDRSEFHLPRLNFLIKRWNKTDSQGNFYLSAGAGTEKFNGINTNATLGEMVADWESRHYYIYFEQRYIRRSGVTNPDLPQEHLNNSKLRLGFAPFLADYSDLNVWLIGQLERENNLPQIEAKLFVRFYMKNVLWEVGAGFDGSIAFNFMVHM